MMVVIKWACGRLLGFAVGARACAMRCTACDAEMMLMKVERSEIMELLGCEHHAFRCSECPVDKWHLVFIRHGRESYNAPMPAQAAPPIVPASTVQDGRTGFIRRLAAKIRGS
jgi:hypothetical protein